MQNDDSVTNRTALSYQRRYYSYYKFRLRVFFYTCVCLVAVGLLVGCFIIQVFNSSTIFPKEYELAEQDMRIIKVSTVFCEGIYVKAANQRRTLRVLQQVQISPQTRVSNVSLEVFVPRNKYWFKAYYLLKGSSILINAKSDSFFKLFIFKRRENLDGWVSRLDASQLRRRSPPEDKNTTTQISFVYTVPQEGNYYILFQRINGQRQLEKLSVEFSLTRHVYELGSAIHECHADLGQDCSTRLMFNSDERALIEVKPSSGAMYQNNVITAWHCEPRVWFFIVVFAGGFLFFLTIGCIVYFVLMSRRKSSFIRECRKQSLRSQSLRSLSRASVRSTRGKPPSRSTSIRSQGNTEPLSSGTLTRDYTQSTRLPSVIPPIYTGDMPDTPETITTPLTPRSRADSIETISLPSLDIVRPRRASFSTFSTAAGDWDTASLRSCPGALVRKHSYRNPHHPGYYQELKREREERAEILRELLRDSEREAGTEDERESLLGAVGGVDEHDGAKSPRDFARKPRDRVKECCDKRAGGTCTRHSGRKRDFFRDLERERQRSESDLNADNRLSKGSDYEKEFENLIESETPYATHKRNKDKVSDSWDSDKPATLPRMRTGRNKKPKANGYIPQIDPIWEKQGIIAPLNNNQFNTSVQVHATPNGSAKPKNHKDMNGNAPQDVKLRNLPSRKKDGFWRPRLSVVSEV
ncbi:uncharacterized protein LOC5507317 [Nematostella vectensis]|uniref:uncharacterized protein LOC5507317 n=1 Tax=Nematostella vectensis TaxID=45351 RepID=UPI0020774F5C|nr:uncharacterized protein LOC5507317 [Nematostella vectensis]